MFTAHSYFCRELSVQFLCALANCMFGLWFFFFFEFFVDSIAVVSPRQSCVGLFGNMLWCRPKHLAREKATSFSWQTTAPIWTLGSQAPAVLRHSWMPSPFLDLVAVILGCLHLQSSPLQTHVSDRTEGFWVRSSGWRVIEGGPHL